MINYIIIMYWEQHSGATQSLHSVNFLPQSKDVQVSWRLKNVP